MATCTSCHASIVWAITDRSKRMPLDATPNPEGNMAVMRDETDTLVCRAITAERPLRPGERAYQPHFASCPNAERHRKPAKAGRR